jgi:hypothetical protein
MNEATEPPRWVKPPSGKVRYELRLNGPAFRVPTQILETDSEEQAIEMAIAAILKMSVKRGSDGRIYIYPQDIKQAVLKPINKTT